MTPRISVVGSCNIDLIVRTPRMPRLGETLTGSDFQTCHGGKGANQAVMAARLGASVAMVGKVGNDLHGQQMCDNFRACGIDTQHVLTDAVLPSGVAVILVDDAAHNCIVVVPGANGALTPDDVRQASATIVASSVLLCQLEVPLETTTEALRIARAAGVRTLLNPTPARSLPPEVFDLADIVVLNETELELFSGTSVSGTAVEPIVRNVFGGRPVLVVVTRGEQGAVVLDDHTVTTIPAFAVKAVDTTGAGDAFVGSLAVFLAEGGTFAEAVRRASAAAALSVTRPGTQPSFPTRAEVESFVQRREGSPGSDTSAH
jgi:ribokinase